MGSLHHERRPAGRDSAIAPIHIDLIPFLRTRRSHNGSFGQHKMIVKETHAKVHNMPRDFPDGSTILKSSPRTGIAGIFNKGTLTGRLLASRAAQAAGHSTTRSLHACSGGR
jgi:hypothetical protein